MSSYPEIDSGGDGDRLVREDEHHESGPSEQPFHKRHKWCLIVTLSFFVIVLGHLLAIYFIYFHCSTLNNCETMRVMALNTWGMPRAFGSKFKDIRMTAIANELSKADYDLYLFTELWMENDHYKIASKVPPGYHVTGFRELALSDCEGRIGPDLCSGLAIVSRYPFSQVHFESYTYHGDPMKAFVDGEWLARKGVGRVRIDLLEGNVTVDIFITHTAAEPPEGHHYSNAYYRVRQVKELISTYVNRSTADVILLGGDFNAGPDSDEGITYKTIADVMTNCVEEIFYKLKQWLEPNFATYGNEKNTFSSMYKPVIYDYIFHKARRSDVMVWTNWFELPFFKTLYNFKNVSHSISLSDHEAITSTIHVWR